MGDAANGENRLYEDPEPGPSSKTSTTPVKKRPRKEDGANEEARASKKPCMRLEAGDLGGEISITMKVGDLGGGRRLQATSILGPAGERPKTRDDDKEDDEDEPGGEEEEEALTPRFSPIPGPSGALSSPRGGYSLPPTSEFSPSLSDISGLSGHTTPKLASSSSSAPASEADTIYYGDTSDLEPPSDNPDRNTAVTNR